MKRVVVALSVMLAVTSMTAHAENIQFHAKERFVDASALDFQEQGDCVIASYWYVAGFKDRIQESGQPTYQPGIVLSLYKDQVCLVHDDCGDKYEYTTLVDVFGESDLPATALQIDSKLTSATVNATISAFDYLNGAPITLNVNIAAAGVGDSDPEKEHVQLSSPGFRVNERFSGTFRDAEAAVSVTDEAGTNYTPDPPGRATLGNIKVGDGSVSHP